MKALQVEHITVTKDGALDMEVACSLAALHVTPEVAAAMLEALPNLAEHVCVNEKGETFGADIVGTELAHLLEHTVIELMAQAEQKAGRSNPGAGLIGHTSWADELVNTRSRGIALMRVKVRFNDDFIALQALKDALQLIEMVCAK